MNTFAKRIQSRAKRKDVAVTLPTVREVYKAIVKDLENPTNEEMDIVLEKVIAVSSGSEETAIIPQPDVIDVTQKNNPDIWANLEQKEDVIAPEQTDSDAESLAPVVQTSSDVQPSSEPTKINEDESGGLATTKGYALVDTDKRSLIQKQASALSVELNTSELTTVVGSIADNYTSFEDACQQIKSIILMVLDQRFERASDVLDDTLLTIVNRASGNFQSLNGRASQGFAAIAQELKRVDTDFKSKSSELESSLKQYLLK
jgi:hypothetical protein